jgi:hypothetical protein
MNTNDTPAIKRLAEKAMQVKLTQGRPSMTLKLSDKLIGDIKRTAGDGSVKARVSLFDAPGSRVKQITSAQNEIYRAHIELTRPFEDKGPRILPCELYPRYRDTMRELDTEFGNMLRLLDNGGYDSEVASDISWRSAAAAAAGVPSLASQLDYVPYLEFRSAFYSDRQFSPLPDQSHWLFDIDEADKATLQRHIDGIVSAGRADLTERIKAPVMNLLQRLKAEPGEKGGIFRDSALSNIHDAVSVVRALSLDDPEILALCELVEQAGLPHVHAADTLRNVATARESAAEKLNRIAARMSWFADTTQTTA